MDRVTQVYAPEAPAWPPIAGSPPCTSGRLRCLVPGADPLRPPEPAAPMSAGRRLAAILAGAFLLAAATGLRDAPAIPPGPGRGAPTGWATPAQRDEYPTPPRYQATLAYPRRLPAAG